MEALVDTILGGCPDGRNNLLGIDLDFPVRGDIIQITTTTIVHVNTNDIDIGVLHLFI